MAGPRGVGPRSEVLETPILPLNYSPKYNSYYIRSRGYRKYRMLLASAISNTLDDRAMNDYLANNYVVNYYVVDVHCLYASLQKLFRGRDNISVRRPNIITVSEFMKPVSKRSRQYVLASVDWKKASVLFQHLPPQNTHPHGYPASKDILHIVAAAGAIGLILAFPPAITGVAAIMKLGKLEYSASKMKRQCMRLRSQRYVEITPLSDGRVSIRITKNGMVRALTSRIQELHVTKSKRWDGKWRLVVFDVPEKKKRIRDRFRNGLRQLGLLPLQQSIYVSPYPCFDEIEFFRELIGVGVNAKYILAETIENDDALRDDFDLPMS